MRIHFDIFSGKTNPSFQFPDAIGRRLFAFIMDSALVPHPTPATFPHRMGYRGFSVELPTELSTRYRTLPKLHCPADFAGHPRLLVDLAATLPFSSDSTTAGATEMHRILRCLLIR